MGGGAKRREGKGKEEFLKRIERNGMKTSKRPDEPNSTGD